MDMPAGIFKAKCLHLMDEVQKYHKEIIITKFGRPVAKLVPVEELENKSLFGYLKGKAVIKGDLLASTGEEWSADV